MTALMTLGGYVSDIGVTYLIMPVVTTALGLAMKAQAARPTEAGQ